MAGRLRSPAGDWPGGNGQAQRRLGRGRFEGLQSPGGKMRPGRKCPANGKLFYQDTNTKDLTPIFSSTRPDTDFLMTPIFSLTKGCFRLLFNLSAKIATLQA